jgi:DNA-directed RNA polymerase subunit RPC12/RpoP
MQKGRLLEFCCVSCKQKICFSIFELDHKEHIDCPECNKKYALNDETLKRQLQKFAALCSQIQESEEILSNTSVGVNVGSQCVKVPYKLLLTRLNSSLDLIIGDTRVEISFRLEPLVDLPKRASINAQ